MNVYAIKGDGYDGGGLAIVAAKNEKEAIEIASHIESYWNVNYTEYQNIEKLPVQYNGEPKVLISFETGE
jgi:hypothetical protein